MMKDSKQPLLIIEDNDADFEALQRLMRQAAIANPICRCLDGDRAIEFFNRQENHTETFSSSIPALIILDLNLPGTDGREVLAYLKQNELLRTIPVVVFTTSSSPQDIKACYREGANSYVVKPMGTENLRQLVQTIIDYWLETVELPLSPASY